MSYYGEKSKRYKKGYKGYYQQHDAAPASASISYSLCQEGFGEEGCSSNDENVNVHKKDIKYNVPYETQKPPISFHNNGMSSNMKSTNGITSIIKSKDPYDPYKSEPHVYYGMTTMAKPEHQYEPYESEPDPYSGNTYRSNIQQNICKVPMPSSEDTSNKSTTSSLHDLIQNMLNSDSIESKEVSNKSKTLYHNGTQEESSGRVVHVHHHKRNHVVHVQENENNNKKNTSQIQIIQSMYQCSFCARSFRREASLKTHLKKHYI